MEQPEVVIYAAPRVRTMDPARPLAEAVAVSQGKILAVGSRKEVQERVRGARWVVWSEGTLLPGLADAHVHLLSLGRALSVVDLTWAVTVKETLARVRRAPASTYQGEWLVGRGWDQNDWTDLGGAFPTAALLDEVAREAPVYLVRVDGHAAWVNSEALRRAGITAETPDPEGGRIERDAEGRPSGVLVDNAMDLVTVLLPKLTDEQRGAWLAAALRRCVEEGLTSVHDAGMDLETFTLLQQWDMAGGLPLRIYAMADGQGADRVAYLERGPFEGRMLRMKSAKLQADGALGSRGAALLAPYADAPEQRGLLLMPPEELEERARAFMERGFQVSIHAIGDRANALAIDVLGRLSEQVEQSPGRHRIEHAQVLTIEDIDRMAELGLIASMQPLHAPSDRVWAEKRLGPARLAGAYAWRSVLDAGVPLAFGSDVPVEPPSPLLGLYSARTRQDAQGRPAEGWQPQQRLSGEEALRAYTVGAAYAEFAEDRRGQLREGMDADLVVVSVDPVEGDAAALLEAKVLLTVVAGKEVHRPEPVVAR